MKSSFIDAMLFLNNRLVAEAGWKYNHRKSDNAFGAFLRGALA